MHIDIVCIAYGVGLVYIHTCGHFRPWMVCSRYGGFLGVFFTGRLVSQPTQPRLAMYDADVGSGENRLAGPRPVALCLSQKPNRKNSDLEYGAAVEEDVQYLSKSHTGFTFWEGQAS
jgi:hypothetical protein